MNESFEQIKIRFNPLKELSNEYIKNPDDFKGLEFDADDEDPILDYTGEYVENLLPQAQESLAECEKYRLTIIEKYEEFVKFMGDDPNKLKFDEFISIMLKFKKELEVLLINFFIYN